MRSSMVELVEYTKRLVGQTEATTPWHDDDIQGQLDLNRIHLEWTLLDRDPDYQTYYCRPHHAIEISTRHVVNRDVSHKDFSHYNKIAFLETDYIIRDAPYSDGVQYTPDSVTWQDGTFIFSTAPNVELFLWAKAYDVYSAVADLLQETPDFGRNQLKSVSILSATHTYDISGDDGKIMMYRRRAMGINKPITKLFRG